MNILYLYPPVLYLIRFFSCILLACLFVFQLITHFAGRLRAQLKNCTKFRKLNLSPAARFGSGSGARKKRPSLARSLCLLNYVYPSFEAKPSKSVEYPSTSFESSFCLSHVTLTPSSPILLSSFSLSVDIK